MQATNSNKFIEQLENSLQNSVVEFHKFQCYDASKKKKLQKQNQPWWCGFDLGILKFNKIKTGTRMRACMYKMGIFTIEKKINI